jgi:hypothetical protein
VKHRFLSLLLIFCFSAPVHSTNLNVAGSMAGQMMDAMWDMMEWFFTQRSPNYRNIPWNYVYPDSPWTYTYPGSPYAVNSNPWSRTDRFSNWSNPTANPWNQGFYSQNGGPSGLAYPDLWTSLDGVWRATSGEYWIVKGNQFVLYGGGDRYLTGNISVQGNHIIAYIPASGMSIDYRFWMVDGMLIVRDEYGSAMVLDLVQPTAGHWQW